jgi:hypothetical protein
MSKPGPLDAMTSAPGLCDAIKHGASLPGLTRQSIRLRKKLVAKKMDPRVKPAGDG